MGQSEWVRGSEYLPAANSRCREQGVLLVQELLMVLHLLLLHLLLH